MNLHQLTDEKLVRLFEAGNSKAFEVLLLRYKSKVFSYIFLFVRNRELTEDIFQDTFIKAIATIQQGKYVESGKFLAWINRIAHNLIIDHFRREKNENTFSADGVEYDIINDTKLSEKSIEDILSNEQVLRDVVQLVDYLPSSQQAVVRMRFFEGLSFKEIAEKTDVSINTALGRMRYALLNMRRMATESDVHLELK
ncbi:sigma-70 family RNA polymerase sigma factor [Paludibacter sp. 221]|uniref:RNA polymerase sigma factor n=1 Tax=Paludibacter sp. 221 TaxID=2302939 RepID=UPI0013D18FC4|nr:sigma-70 family RNA polymerase sigma factor [Paludibacter sp. 221]NDV45977.1 sigma-70 family RNA polymerase sigma factor [Paludibacter sp. 221]